MLDALASSVVTTVARVDRLARGTFDVFAIIKQIVDAKAQFPSLGEPWAGASTGRLMIAALGGLADVEGDLIRARTGEGRERVKARRQTRPQTKIDGPPTALCNPPARRAKRAGARHRARLQCLA